jgi:uncharacterized protein (TIGR02421 family)
LTADAAAGGNSIHLRRDACFAVRQIRLLEVHEGWVHLGTTRNGRRQPVCTFLGRCSPVATVTQEGLAVLTELATGACDAARWRQLVHRVEAVARAEAGADFLDVFRFFLGQGYGPRGSYYQAVRIFRGGLPQKSQPFTKDLCYIKGLLELAADPSSLRWLFCGKTSLADAKQLGDLAAEGILLAPRYVPPVFEAAGARPVLDQLVASVLGGKVAGEQIQDHNLATAFLSEKHQ